MQKTKLGKTGLEVSRVIWGGMIVNGETQEDANKYVSQAIDMGVNFFDVAPLYGDAETKLGPALKAYRKNVSLACKTYEKSAKGARASIENSLKTLQTDYFDLFQLHCLIEVGDIDKVFAEDGAMTAILAAKKEGLIKHIGLTAHNEETALLGLSKFEFETVMFPINWSLDLSLDFGIKLPQVCAQKNIGLIAMKSFAHRKWRPNEEQSYPKSWSKPIDNDKLWLSAFKYALSRNVDAVVPPGHNDHFCQAVKHLDECLANPLDDEDMQYLKDSLPEIDELVFKLSSDRRLTSENRR